jgi:solute carrier family 25 citrate transporter 1
LLSVPKAGIRFGGFEFLNKNFADEKGKVSSFGNFASGMTMIELSKPRKYLFGFPGVGAGVIEATFAVTPMETIKLNQSYLPP